MNTTLLRRLLIAALALFAHALPAATVQFAGVINDDSGSQITQWRTASTPKPIDPDGDNLFGTAGRILFGVGQFGQETVFRFDSSDPIVGPFAGYAVVDGVNGGDDVAVRTTTNNGAGGTDDVMFTFTALAGCPVNVRIGIATDGLNGAQFSPASIGLRQVGGSSAEQTLTAVNSTLDMVFFDVTNVAPGDQFEIFADSGTGGFTTIQLVTFDARPILVTNTNDSGPGSLRAALDEAAAVSFPALIGFAPALNGATIPVSTFTDTGSGNSAFSIPAGNTVIIDASTLPAGLTIDGQLGGFRIFQVNSGSFFTLKGLTLTRGGGTQFNGDGGAILNSSGILSLSRCTLAGNSVQGNGGAILTTGNFTMSLSQCTLSGNSAASGGAIASAGKVTLTQCTLSGNSAGSGGAFMRFSGGATLEHCTISANTAPPGQGGGVGFAGGSPAIHVQNTIISGNANSDVDMVDSGDLQNSIFSLGGNIIGTGNATALFDPLFGDTLSNSPMLASLGRYGGPTATMPPLPGSPARDTAGAIAGLTTDQRGSVRGTAIWNVATAQPSGLIFRGSAASPFRITQDVSNQSGTAVLPDFGDISSFAATFTYQFIDSQANPGDGLSFCFGPDPGGIIDGTGSGAAHVVRFDIYNNGAPRYGAISYIKNGVVQASNTTTLDRVADNVVQQPVSVTVSNTGLLTVKYKGITVIDAVPTGYTYTPGDRIMIGGSTGPIASAEQRIVAMSVLLHPTVVPDSGAVESLSGPVTAVVTSNADSGPGTLRDILAVVPTGSTITFDPAAFTSANTILLTGPSGGSALTIDKAVTIDATGIANGVKLDGQLGDFRIFEVNTGASLALHGLTLTRGGGLLFGNGGAILNNGSLSVNRCTLSGNIAFASGGAIYNNGTLSLTQCTLSGNTSVANFGGALVNASGTATLTHCTISGNSALAARGSGVASFAGGSAETVVKNSIISGNTNSSVDLDLATTNTFTSLGGNLIGTGNATAYFNAPGDILNNAPQLSALGNNGGPTQTMALLSSSPARGAAIVLGSPITTDQRGFPIAGLPDIGAYEFPNTPPSAFNTAATATTGDQKTITVSASDVDGIAPAIVGTPTTGAGLVVNSTNGLNITLTPSTDFVGDVLINYNVSDGNGGFASGSVTVNITDNDAPQIGGTFSPLVVYAGTMPDFRSQAVASDNVSTPTITQSPVQGSPITAGTVPVTITATDAAGNTADTTFNLVVRPSAPVHTTNVLVAGVNTPLAPGAGMNGLPADAKLVSLSQPATNDFGDIGFVAKWKSATAKGTGLFLNDECLAIVGGDASAVVPGATWKSFTDPVVSFGRLACIATLSTGVKAVVINAGGVPMLVSLARTGDTAQNAGDAKLKKFTSFSLNGESICLLATLTGGTGVNKITAANDTGLWLYSINYAEPILRDGLNLGETVDSFISFMPGNGSPGQGRGWYSDNASIGLFMPSVTTFTDKTKAIIFSFSGNTLAIARTGDTGTNLAPPLPGASYASFGLPAMNDDIRAVFSARMTPGAGGVTKADATGIFTTKYIFGIGVAPHELLARIGSPAGATGTKFAAFKDPIIAANGGIAFPATLKPSPTVKGLATQTLWWKPFGQPLALLAQGGARPGPDLPATARWKSFTSLAIADRGPIFAATLVPGKGGVTPATATGVWACDFTGAPRVLFRTGDIINGKKLAKYTLLKATTGNVGVTRSFNNASQVTWLATFTDKSSAIITTEVP